MGSFESMLSNLSSPPTLLVISGDLVNRGSARIDDLEYFKKTLEGWGIPYLVCPGNHDLTPSKRFAEMYPGMEDMESVPLSETNFGSVFGLSGLRGEISIDGIRILSFALRDEDPDGQIDWLEERLATTVPTIVFGHYPVLASRSGGFCSTWGYARIANVRDRLRNVLACSPAKVIAYCAGHQHLNSVVRNEDGSSEKPRKTTQDDLPEEPHAAFADSPRGFTQIVTGALGTSPYCYRWIDIENGCVSFSTEFLDGFEDWMTEAMNPDKAIDEEHPDNKSYYLGLPREQRITIC